MMTGVFTNMISKLSSVPDKICIGPGFHGDMRRFGESLNAQWPMLFCVINKTKIYFDPLVQGKRVKIFTGKKEKTFNWKTFVRHDKIDFQG